MTYLDAERLLAQARRTHERLVRRRHETQLHLSKTLVKQITKYSMLSARMYALRSLCELSQRRCERRERLIERLSQ